MSIQIVCVCPCSSVAKLFYVFSRIHGACDLTFIWIFCIFPCMETITKKEIQERLENNKDFIKSKFYVSGIGLFGSFVTGESTESSDIDILVEFKKGHKDFFNYMRLKNYLQEVLGREVDLVMKSAVKPRLKESILSRVQYV